MDTESGFGCGDFPGFKEAKIFPDTAQNSFIPKMDWNILDLDPERYLGWEAWRDGGFPFFEDNHPVSKMIGSLI